MAELLKNQPANTGDISSIPGLGRSPGEQNGKLMNRGDWCATINRVTELDVTEYEA